MTALQWKRRIKAACNAAGTYKKQYDSIIDTLANIMAIRDNAQEQYIASGSRPVVGRTAKNGKVNLVKNPILTVILDANAQALAYWRDLGLTPAGFRKLENSVKTDGGSFASMFEGLEL